ncbi:MAG: TRAM domain-containing protein [Phycisphaerales bacterium]|nr:TRAM domain-containing protein [Phycisphaerales bacterium]
MSDYKRNPEPSQLELEQMREKTTKRLVILTIRLLFIAFMFAAAILPFIAGINAVNQPLDEVIGNHLGPLISTVAFAAIVLIIDILTPNKRLSAVLGVYMGLVAGLFAALAVSLLIDLIGDSWGLKKGDTALQYLTLLKLVTGITLCYFSISIVFTTKDNLRLVLPYVEFARQVRGIRPLLVDTSILIDGRIEKLSSARFLDSPIIIPQFVIDELHRLSDSGDKLKRSRGRRGLNILSNLQHSPHLDVSIDSMEGTGTSVDRSLIELARVSGYRVLTTDSNLQKVGQIEGITVLNLNDLSTAVKTQAIPGAHMELEIVKHGESDAQGVGYLQDGTMVVVENGGTAVGKVVTVKVTNSLQTSAGRMIFAEIDE